MALSKVRWLLVVAMVWAMAPTVGQGAVCGDGLWDRDWELCDDGAANGTDGCCSESCEVVDGDGDGVCDAADPCASPAPPLQDVTFVLRGVATPEPDDSFELTATLAPTAPIDPAADGLSVVVQEELIGSIVSAVIPGGAGWKMRAGGGWTFRGRRDVVGGITRINVKPAGAGRYAIAIEGRRRSYPITGTRQLYTVSLAFGSPFESAGRCGEGFLPVSRCAYTGSGNTLRCAPPPGERRCTSASIEARIRCDVMNAVTAQEAYYATHHLFLSGECSSVLPGFVSSPGVSCSTIGHYVFTVVVSSSDSSLTCIYDSAPRAGLPNPRCEP